MPRPTGDQFSEYPVPQESLDYAWEVTLRPELDQEYKTKSGDPYIIPGHMHFDKEGNPFVASGACSGKHNCPPATQAMRTLIAHGHATKKRAQNN